MLYTELLAFTRPEAAEALRVSLRTVDTLLAQGAIKARHIGRRVVIPKTEIQRLLRRDTAIGRNGSTNSARKEAVCRDAVLRGER